MANWFAYFALLFWPAVAIYFFNSRPIGQAIIWTILGAFLLLPPKMAIKFQMVPALDKSSIPNIAVLLGCALMARRFPRLLSRFGLAEVLILMLLVGSFITSALNSDPIVVGPTVIPGVGIYDAASASISEFLFFLPFILGRQYLSGEASAAEILRALVVAGLFYSLPILLEVRMSPQLNVWIYGYFPSSFAQEMRDGGFRPFVFLGNGLNLSFFTMTTVLASAALWRTKVRVFRLPSAAVAGYLSAILILCKSLGAFVYGAAIAPLVRWATPQTQLRVAVLLVVIALAYPVLRAANLFPSTSLVNLAASVNADRAQSLNFRFENEDMLLRHASERFWFGWGRFGRNRVYNQNTGGNISVTDGEWIIRMGTFGFVGFVAEFGLIALGVFRASSAIRFAASMRERIFLGAVALIVSINLVDLLPNASISPWTWLLAGALLGQAERLHAAGRRRSRINPGVQAAALK